MMGTAKLPVPVALPRRHSDWPTRLDAAIEAARWRAFDWREHNCATFAADCVRAMTGATLHDHFAGLHRDKRRAARAFADGDGLEAYVAALLGGPGLPPTLAKRGDVLLMRCEGMALVAICLGTKAACLGPKGIEFVGMEHARCAWPV